MAIRPAAPDELSDIMRVYEAARRFMRQNGNFSQWINGYPSPELISEDIRLGYCHVEADDGIRGVFALIPGDDPTYARIEDGAWLNSAPYCTIHRMGSDGSRPGFLGRSLAYCRRKASNLRIDTHADNHLMRRGLEAHGFQYCGIIHVADGTPRMAYQSHLRESL